MAHFNIKSYILTGMGEPTFDVYMLYSWFFVILHMSYDSCPLSIFQVQYPVFCILSCGHPLQEKDNFFGVAF